MPRESRETRVLDSFLAAAEKRLLVRIAGALPHWINSDHLTALSGLSMAGLCACYWLAPSHPTALVGVIVMLALNWFGDSLDGTVARVRKHERPRYGFYVDHVLDAVGILLLVGGLALGGFMSPIIAAGFLVAYYLLMIEIALATHALGTFRISYWKFGPTELRILLAIGTLQLLRSDTVVIAGSRYLLFDAGGACAIAALLVTFVVAAVGNTRKLYRMEPLPGAPQDHSEKEAKRAEPAESSHNSHNVAAHRRCDFTKSGSLEDHEHNDAGVSSFQLFHSAFVPSCLRAFVNCVSNSWERLARL